MTNSTNRCKKYTRLALKSSRINKTTIDHNNYYFLLLINLQKKYIYDYFWMLLLNKKKSSTLSDTRIKCIFDGCSSIWNIRQRVPCHRQWLNYYKKQRKYTVMKLKNGIRKKFIHLDRRSKKWVFTTIAATKVKTNDTITMIVAMNRFLSNIFLSCLIGPTKKQVL